MIRLLIAEDQALVSGAMAALLDLESDIKVVGTAADGAIALESLAQSGPVDVLLTDIEMPNMTGLELAETMREQYPDTRVVIVTTFGRAGYLRRALEAGVRGYLLKDTPAERLADAVRRIARGERVIAPELALSAWDGQNPLTERQRQVLRLAGEGLSTRQISEQLHLAEGTVRNYLSEAISELQAANRIDAYRLARQQGWL
ncbi:MAG: response regulator transcription factor [Wenzhouxiangella sp.]|jgi:two-component system response regulator DesR|nr:response regulator transcription factor [Wenzhouxiangella sp.]